MLSTQNLPIEIEDEDLAKVTGGNLNRTGVATAADYAAFFSKYPQLQMPKPAPQVAKPNQAGGFVNPGLSGRGYDAHGRSPFDD